MKNLNLEENFAAEMSSLLVFKQLAVACSGGGDSMALTLLAQEWAEQNGIELIAITVNHNLRAEAEAEAMQVGVWLAERNIKHVILTWQGEKPASNIQETARKERYRLMCEFCKEQGIENLLVAHHLEDQAETFMLRLIRGSGVDGLAAMAKISTQNGLNIIRPLLGVQKASLLDYLQSKNQQYVNDPSNRNLAYDRIKVRKFLPELAKLGLSVERIAATAANMARAREYLDCETQEFIATNCEFLQDRSVILQALPQSEEIALRVLAALLMQIGGSEVKPRLNSLQRVYQHISQDKFKPITLGGCVFKYRKGTILILPEVGI